MTLVKKVYKDKKKVGSLKGFFCQDNETSFIDVRTYVSTGDAGFNSVSPFIIEPPVEAHVRVT